MKLKIAGAWALVGIPLAYGIIETLRRAAQLFTG
ncbi:MFS transporter small subunit [Nocardioides sp. CCNWLW239]